MYLGGVNFSLEKERIKNLASELSKASYLDNVQNGYVAVLVDPVPVSACADHHVLGLQQPPHHVQHCSLANIGMVLVSGEGGVPSHQEVESGGGD